MMCSRPRARRKIFSMNTHPRYLLVGLARGKALAAIGHGARREFPSCGGPFVSHVWSRGSTLHTESNEMCCWVLAGHSAIAFRRRESRRGSTIVQGVVVMAKGYPMCVRAMPGQYIGSPWRGVPGGNHHSIPGYTCMRGSRAPIRAALRFVEIANKSRRRSATRNSPAVLREHTQFGPRGSS